MVGESSYFAILQPLLAKEEKLSMELNAVRAAISALRSAADANAPALSELPAPRASEGMSFSEMTSKAIQAAGRALVAREILEFFVQHGAVENDSEASLIKVQTALNRRAKEVGDIAHIGDGKWVWKKWYTEKELQDLTTNIDGANARDREEHRKRTKEGIAAHKARGHKMGKMHFVKDHPKRLARARELADLVVSGGITGKQFVAEMHKAQPEPVIKSVQSFYNWKSQGFDGLAAKVRLVK
ncbi:MAG: hypothetical protein WA782_18135 [Sulfitobacter sp.]